MPSGARDTEEVFAPYGNYLESALWPSIRDGNKELEVIEVMEMPPQRASACLGKLIRWARREPAGDIALIDDVDQRQEEVMGTVLGQSLAARALSLGDINHLHALYGETGQGAGVDPHTAAAELVVAMGERFPEWELRSRIELGVYLAHELSKKFLIKERSND